MLTRQELLENKELRQNYARGALIGLAIGDSFGDACRVEENHQKFGITMEFGRGSSWSTDDTEFALLTAQILINCGGELTQEVVKEAWMEHVVTQNELHRGGGSEIEAAYNLREGLTPPESGKYNFYHMSDGAAMRIAPIGIMSAGEPEKAAKLAEIDASISHWRDGIWGAQAVAAAVSVAMADGTVDEIVETALNYAPEGSWFRHNFLAALELVDQADSLEEVWMPLHTKFRSEYKAAVPEAIVQAFALFKLLGGEIDDSLIYSGNFGRDADTIGAVVGSLCGALHGADELPEHWIEKTRYPTGTCLEFTEGLDILEFADQITDLMD